MTLNWQTRNKQTTYLGFICKVELLDPDDRPQTWHWGACQANGSGLAEVHGIARSEEEAEQAATAWVDRKVKEKTKIEKTKKPEILLQLENEQLREKGANLLTEIQDARLRLTQELWPGQANATQSLAFLVEASVKKMRNSEFGYATASTLERAVQWARHTGFAEASKEIRPAWLETADEALYQWRNGRRK